MISGNFYISACYGLQAKKTLIRIIPAFKLVSFFKHPAQLFCKHSDVVELLNKAFVAVSFETSKVAQTASCSHMFSETFSTLPKAGGASCHPPPQRCSCSRVQLDLWCFGQGRGWRFGQGRGWRLG